MAFMQARIKGMNAKDHHRQKCGFPGTKKSKSARVCADSFKLMMRGIRYLKAPQAKLTSC